MLQNCLFILVVSGLIWFWVANGETNFIDKDNKLKGFEEKDWFKRNIPFVDLPDKQVEEVYYYRWSSHKRHLRYVTTGAGYMVTEFVNNVGYAKKFESIIAAAGHHVYESRWLREQRFVKDYINFYTRVNTNDNYENYEKYGEWLAESVYAAYLINGDKAFVTGQLQGLIKIYNYWQSHFDSNLGLYFISPLYDAQEYSAASVQTKDKFGGGTGFRPSFNAEMYGNALAISKIASLVGDERTAKDFSEKASALRDAILSHLWDPKRKFFYHMQKDNNPGHVLLDSREEVGFYPWRFMVPDNRSEFEDAWDQLTKAEGFGTEFGPATCETRSKWYDGNQTSQCCWWNGNSWPYSTALTLKGLANQINNLKNQKHRNADDYFKLLKKYTKTHYKNGKPYVAECHSPGGDFWVCDSRNHSEHYAHSTFTDNILSELLGVRGREDNYLELKPLIPSNWSYFAVENIPYHGHLVTILYDQDGAKYKKGKGFIIYINNKLSFTVNGWSPGSVIFVPIPASITTSFDQETRKENYAANLYRSGYPRPDASFTDDTGCTYQAVDGRVVYDYIPSNRWSNWQSPNPTDWFSVDFGRVRRFDSVNVYVYSDVVTKEGGTDCPTKMVVQYFNNNTWFDALNQTSSPKQCSPNDKNVITFDPVETDKLRIVFTRNAEKGYFVGITELEIWARWPQGPNSNTYEAEDAIIWKANLVRSEKASGGAFVGQIDSLDSYVEFTGIYRERTGNARLRVYYANAWGSLGSHKLVVNNFEEFTVQYPVTENGWGHFDDKTYVEVEIPLLSGDNDLIFKHDVNFAELDKIEIVD